VIPYQAGEWLTQLRNVIVTVGALQRLGIGPQATNGGIAQHSVGNLPQSAVTTSHTTNKLMGRGGICVNPLALAPVSRVLHFRHFLGRIGTARPLLKLDFGRGDRIRTCDPLFPKQMRYQAAPLPDEQRTSLTGRRLQ
jgi:hypothetical protein